ncbi:MAG TPA: hypothetical protein VGJ63_23855 [Micromonosporaceae bacterium]|jgi:hypothetical protein
MDTLHDLARRLDGAADALARAGAALEGLAIDARVFGADVPGRLGEAGRAMHARWASALAARIREAAAAGARVSDTAQTVRVAAASYRDADEVASRRHRRRT